MRIIIKTQQQLQSSGYTFNIGFQSLSNKQGQYVDIKHLGECYCVEDHHDGWGGLYWKHETGLRMNRLPEDSYYEINRSTHPEFFL